MQITNKQAEPSNIVQCLILSNQGDVDIDITNSIVSLLYYESVLDPTVRVTLTVVDTGYRDGSNSGSILESGNVNISTGEKVILKFYDNNEQPISFGESNSLTIKEVRNIVSNTKYTTCIIDLWSEESIYNNLNATKVSSKYYGKTSDTVTKILRNNLKTNKTLDIETSQNTLQYIGRNQKPFYCFSELALRSVPKIANSINVLAGFFFYETSLGYSFKSLDSLLKQQPKRVLIANDTTLIPSGYSGKIYKYNFSSNYDIERVMFSGSFSKSKIKVFDPVTEKYTEDIFDYEKQYRGDTNLGLKFPVIDKNWKFKNESRTYTTIERDIGTHTDGETYQDQLKNSSNINFNAEEVVRQAISRYNQLYSNKLAFTTVGDLGLNAGDIIHCDFPEVTSDKSYQENSSTRSGLYMITDICHRFSTDGTWSRVHCVRDSFGRKPF